MVNGNSNSSSNSLFIPQPLNLQPAAQALAAPVAAARLGTTPQAPRRL